MKLKNNFLIILSAVKTKSLFINITLILLAVLPSMFSPSGSYNFWNRLYDTFTNNLNILIIILVIFLNMINLTKELKNSTFILKYDNYTNYLFDIMKINIIYSVFLIIINFLFCIISTWLICIFIGNLDVSIVNNTIYDIPIIWYLLFFLLREYIIILFLTIIFYLIYQGTNSKITLLCMIGFLSTFFINPRVFEVPLFITGCFYPIKYSSFFLELSYTIIQFIILYIIFEIIQKVLSKRKELI